MKPYKVLASTKNMSRDEWLKVRKFGIGGSDAAKIAGVSKYGSAWTVFLEKTNQLPEEQNENEFMYWGNVMEPVLAKEFERRTGLRVKRVNAVLQSVEFPFMLANLDRVVVGQNVGVEIKTASAYLAKEWDGDKLPDQYYIQCLHYLALTGFDSWWIAVLIGGNDFRFKEVKRDEELISRLVEVEREFWRKVESGEMPSVDGSEAASEYVSKLFPTSNGEHMELGSSVLHHIAERERLREEVKTLEELAKQHENEIKLAMGENEKGTIADYVVSWKNVTSNRVDTNFLKENYPEIYNNCLSVSTSRRFEVK